MKTQTKKKIDLLLPEWFSDSGHAWLRVEVEELKALNILEKITSYSYIERVSVQDHLTGEVTSRLVVYLEEDCDAGTFLRAKFKTQEERMQFSNSLKDNYSHNSFVRYLQHFPAKEE